MTPLTGVKEYAAQHPDLTVYSVDIAKGEQSLGLGIHGGTSTA